MKKTLLAIGLGTLVATSAFASSNGELVCTNIENSRKTTVVVKKSLGDTYKMTVYRTVSGHNSLPQSVDVKTLRATRGPVLVYGNQDQSKVLSLNFLNRNAQGEINGTYTDFTQKENLQVTCE